jgi:hypothetical protein
MYHSHIEKSSNPSNSLVDILHSLIDEIELVSIEQGSLNKKEIRSNHAVRKIIESEADIAVKVVAVHSESQRN